MRELATIYRRAIAKVTEAIIGSDGYSNVQRIVIRQKVTQLLGQINTELVSWADKEIPAVYKAGVADAEAQLKRLGVKLERLLAFTVIDQDAVEAILNEVKGGFATSMQTIGQSTQRILKEATKLEANTIMAEGIITGEANKKIAREIKGIIQDEGIAGFIDKSGRKWQLDNYTQMLVRTKLVEARNVGLGNRMGQYGFDLVQVSDHNSDHPVCAAWEGQILSMRGETEGYPTYDEAVSDGLFHPNCEHAINAVHPELASKTEAYDNPFN